MSLKVKSQAGETIHFKIRRSTRLGKLMDAYCDTRNIARHGVSTFLYDGQRISHAETPLQLEMEDGDEIDAMLHDTCTDRGAASPRR
jgi:small ubiquitin-related modifier